MRIVLPLTVSMILACAGPSVPIAPYLGEVCALSAAVGVPMGAELVAIDRAPVAAGNGSARSGIEIVAGADRIEVDGVWIETPGDLEPRVMEAKERARHLAEAMGETSAPEARAYLAPETPAATVVAIFEASARAGLARIAFAAWSTEAAPDVPAPLDAAFAEELRAEMDAASPEMRAMRFAERFASEIALCPGAQRTFEAVAMASPDVRCELLAQGLSEALPSCPFTNADRVLTMVWALQVPTNAQLPTSLPVAIDRDAPPLTVPASARWRDIANALAARDPLPGWVAISE